MKGEVDRDVAVHRNARLLAAAQGFAQLTFPVLLVTGTVAATELSHRDGASGLVWAVYFGVAAVAAVVIGRWMDRVGRRPGLLVALAFTALGGLGCAAAVLVGSFPLLILSVVPFGIGYAGVNLTRAAVADMYPPAHRARAVGILLAVGTIGAVGSPLLIAFLRGRAADPRTADLLPWLIVPLGALIAGGFVMRVRPDPRDLAPPIEGDFGPESRPARSPRELLRVPAFRTAILAAAVGQIAMVGVMGVTPAALHHLGHGDATIAWIISLHIGGMFAFSPLIGAAMDRWGRRLGLIAGCSASIVGALVAGTGGSAAVVGGGLFALGIGWSATFLGATAVISDVTTPAERAGALGFTDLFVSACSATAGVVSGIVLETAGYPTLGVVTAVLVTLVLGVVLWMRPVAGDAVAVARD
ncbi:MAG TPA: MFS transporter [Actinomycetota bacterium]|nr:MFS transporter [Actinomycetota bacterium]